MPGEGRLRSAADGGSGGKIVDLTDHQLVERVQGGDKRAFDVLVRKYQGKVAGLVSRYVFDHAEVEDVVQEVFIKAYRALDRFRGDSAFYTWLYRIAVNTAKNHLVASGRRPPGQDVDVADVVNTDAGYKLQETDSPERSMMTRQIAELLQATLRSLPEDLREAIMLREIEGMSYEEIAEVMACPIGTVRSRIFRAREALDRDLKAMLEK
ncbi:MAG: RNA polymerase sigma factor RpoE [Proteobacteria bacterium]|nr:MAG: RNA polymerase sigma factor RpoE [Pseudomonadota bacterium]